MKKFALGTALGLACFAVAGNASAQISDVDSLTCVNVSTDRRFADPPPALTLTPEQEEFMASEGCTILGGTRIARADDLCFATSVEPDDGDEGIDLSGQAFLCYDVRCRRDEMNLGGRTELTVSDQFGSGTLFVNERPNVKKLCVPAFVGDGPTPTPTPTPIGTPTPTPSGTPGSASRAFVDPVPSLLR